jgi:hypothetical protein
VLCLLLATEIEDGRSSSKGLGVESGYGKVCLSFLCSLSSPFLSPHIAQIINGHAFLGFSMRSFLAQSWSIDLTVKIYNTLKIWSVSNEST